MFDCNCLIHPFQNDAGTSQRERIMEELLSGTAKIDARTLADLLDYFVQLSRHINYYDSQLNVSDWQPFFKSSIPFTLASVINYKPEQTQTDFTFYNSLFEKNPSSTGLQLQAYFIFYHFINKINYWHLAVKGSGLPIEKDIQVLIKDKLQQALKDFIGYTNAAVKWYGIKKIDFLKLYENEVWNLDLTDLYSIDNSFKNNTQSKHRQLINLYNNFKNVFPSFFSTVKVLSLSAENNLEQSLLPLKDELQKTHPPHLGLLFAFLNMFRQLQNDLNGYTRRHLDFFYKDVLQIKSREAVADKTHVLFEVQKQLEKYLIKKGILVKDGKDNNKQEILFSLDDDIVVNKTELAETRTLYLNNQTAHAQTYVEGVYMAAAAQKADGVDKDFKDDEPKNFYTLGNKFSKYSDPETKIIKPYSNARIGFILASPVLYLQEGTRTVDISVACELKDSICKELESQISSAAKDCCNDNTSLINEENEYPNFYLATKFYNDINTALNETYYYISQDLIKEAVKKGISKNLADILIETFLTEVSTLCYCPEKKLIFDATITEAEFLSATSLLLPGEKLILAEIIKPRKALTILLSGEKEWIEPSDVTLLRLEPAALPASNKFILHITATLNADKPAVTFYDKEKLKEDFGTTQPLAKIELDDKIKLKISLADKTSEAEAEDDCCAQEESCCLLKGKDEEKDEHTVSLYHFFRNVEVIKKIGSDPQNHTDETKIDVQVCGLKNFIVQNDESVQDVNSAIMPFGSLPKINANFYIGCKEIFCKKWQKMAVNFNWKDKPIDLKSYYHGYEDILLNIKADDFDEPKFKFMPSVLNDGQWINNTTRELFTTNLNHECGSYLFMLNTCNVNTLFSSDGWVKRTCVNSDFVNTACIKETCLNTDGTIKAACLNGNVIKLNSFKPEFVKTIAGVDYIDYNCIKEATYSYVFHYNDFSSYNPLNKLKECFQKEVYSVNTRNGFIKFALLGQDFQHDRYSFVLTRQMMALGKFPDIYIGPVYDGNVTIPTPPGFTTVPVMTFDDMFNSLKRSLELSTNIRDRLDQILPIIVGAHILGGNNTMLPHNLFYDKSMWFDHFNINPPPTFPPNSFPIPEPVQADSPYLNIYSLKDIVDYLEDSVLKPIYDKIEGVQQIRVVIPNQPYTPQIKGISLDYTATATIEDIDLIHLYPYTGTYKHEEIELQPTLFPTFCDEGTLFLGLKQLIPGNNLNILFQLAEATSDSESAKEEIHWHYLDGNIWKPLRKGFEVMDDASENLTASGIIKFAMPANMTKDNTVMPKDLYWIKATIAKNSKAVAETTGIHPQAMLVTFTNDEANDKLRLSEPLAAGSISKLNEADANVKTVQQPYESSGGRIPEMEGQFYVRVSEHLRHKGRAIQKFDYERLVLEAFPQVFKAKCINHSFALDAHVYTNDFPYAPGYIILAVIPDLYKLKAGNSFEPKVPVSIIEKIEAHIRKCTSPFVRFRAMNPRFEKINFCLRIKLMPDKDENYYREKLKQDVKELLAPWAIGEYDKLTFGQCIYRSDIIRFLERRDYVDYINDFKMAKESETPADVSKLCPDTPRSILIAGEIEVCIESPECENWGDCIDANKVDCCETELIPVADYCEDKIDTIG